jgi:hypothetical protein
MIAHLDMHLLDLFQNALASEASEVSVVVRRAKADDRLTLAVSDNGMGMDEETLQEIERGPFSGKRPGGIGLGIPLLRQTAEHCDGTFRIESRRGRGTTVTASFRLGHIDLPTFDDLAETFVIMLVTSDGRRVDIRYETDESTFAVSTEILARHLDGLPLSNPDVVAFLRAYIAESVDC